MYPKTWWYTFVRGAAKRTVRKKSTLILFHSLPCFGVSFCMSAVSHTYKSTARGICDQSTLKAPANQKSLRKNVSATMFPRLRTHETFVVETKCFCSRLRLRQRIRYKTIGFNEQTNGLHVRYNFWYISLPYSAKQQREMTKFKFWGGRGTHDGEFLTLCLNSNAIPTNYLPR